MYSQKRFWLRIVLFAVFLSFAIWLLTNYLTSNSAKPSSNCLKTPEVTGLTIDKASEVLTARGLKLKVKSRKSSSFEKGIIISQLPLPGEDIKKNEAVYVIVSLGEPTPTLTSQLPTISPVNITATVTLATPKTESNLKSSYSNFIVCLDPGHQAKANLSPEPIGPGSTKTKPKVAGGGRGINSKTPESQIVLKIALKLRSLLEEKGIKVVMTRTREEVNISNIQRAQVANEAKADLFVRVHLDSNSNTSISGITTLYPAKNQWTQGIYQQSKKAAQIVHPYVIKETGAINRGLSERGDMTGFNWSKVPVILIESGFLSNPAEDKKLNTENYQTKIARGLAKGILAFLKEN